MFSARPVIIAAFFLEADDDQARYPPVAEQRTIDLMLRNSDRSPLPDTRSEIGTVRKSWHSRVSIALVYPNHYHVGMSNLGFQTLYRLFNSYDHVVCERAFLPDDGRSQTTQLKTFESGRSLAAADIIAFSLSFENDYPHLLAILDKAGIGFFYTIAKGELRGWPIAKGTRVVEAAGKIHSDLARGFIKAEVVGFDDRMSAECQHERICI